MAPESSITRQAEARRDVSWATIKGWSVTREQCERQIAAALRVKLNKLGEKRWLAQCAKEMGWSRATAYRHLNPEKMEAAREAARAQRANVSTVETSRPEPEPAPVESGPEPVEPEPVKAKSLRSQYKERDEERIRKIAARIIAAGYKVLSEDKTEDRESPWYLRKALDYLLRVASVKQTELYPVDEEAV